MCFRLCEKQPRAHSPTTPATCTSVVLLVRTVGSCRSMGFSALPGWCHSCTVNGSDKTHFFPEKGRHREILALLLYPTGSWGWFRRTWLSSPIEPKTRPFLMTVNSLQGHSTLSVRSLSSHVGVSDKSEQWKARLTGEMLPRGGSDGAEPSSRGPGAQAPRTRPRRVPSRLSHAQPFGAGTSAGVACCHGFRAFALSALSNILCAKRKMEYLVIFVLLPS